MEIITIYSQHVASLLSSKSRLQGEGVRGRRLDKHLPCHDHRPFFTLTVTAGLPLERFINFLNGKKLFVVRRSDSWVLMKRSIDERVSEIPGHHLTHRLSRFTSATHLDLPYRLPQNTLILMIGISYSEIERM
jgi:hypothetical protein